VNSRPRGTLLLLLLLAGFVLPARAGGNLETVAVGKIANIAWSTLRLPIPWKINDQGVINNCNNGNLLCVGGVSPITLQRAIDGISAAFGTWQAVPTSKIAFTYTGTSPATDPGADGVNLITWAASSTNCPTNVIAVTPNFSISAPLTLTSSNRDVDGNGIIDFDPAIYPNGTVLPAGTIYDADTAFCSASFDFVDTPIDDPSYGTLDFVGVGTHELGHFHGLAHSTLTAPFATMFPFVDNTVDWGNDARVLSQDDIASTSRYYPETSFAATTGTITGRVFMSDGVTPAEGVSVTAYNKATGAQTVQVFSVSHFTNTTDIAGSFRIDGLPPGSYYVGVDFFDGSSTAGADDGWWYNQRFNLTILNGNVTGANVRPIIIARSEFLSSPENAFDDLADPVTVSIAAAQTLNAGSIIINTGTPTPPTGATALNLPNGAYVEVAFPAGFTFPYYDQSYASVFVGDNANLTFGPLAASNLNADTRNFLGPDQTTLGPVPPRIGLPFTNLDPGADNTGGHGGPPIDVWSKFVADAVNGDRMEITYLGVPFIGTHRSCTAIARLFRSGRVEIQYRAWSATWGTVGLSPGGTGSEPATEIDFTRNLPYSGSTGQAIFEHFEMAQKAANGGANHFRHGFDLDGQLLIFTPNGGGGYNVTSPDLATLPPGEIQNLRFTGQTAFAWDARADAVSYNVYRGALGGFTDTNADGAADSYGSCLDPGLTSASDIDASIPSGGGGYFYLITGRNPGGEGPLGNASSGAPRPDIAPCP